MNINKTKVISLKSNTAGVIPTVPTVSNHKTPGWLSPTDIYEGEFFFNTADQALYLRAGNSIIQIGGATVSRYLDDMIDVDAATPSSADILTFDGTNWISKQTFDGVLNVDETLRSVYQEGCTLGALAARSFATGLSTYVSGSYGHTEGAGTSASNYAHAEGQNTIASGDISHSEGMLTTASGQGAHAEGQNTTASGDGSHVEGFSTVASGDYSHAEGAQTYAEGPQSHAEGSNTVASGDHSHAEGEATLASGTCSHAEGSSSIALRDYQYSSGGSSIDTQGDAQYCRIVYRVQTTNATQTTIATFNTETNHIYGCRVLGIGVVKTGSNVGSTSVFGGYNTSDARSTYGYIKNIGGSVSTSFSKIYELDHANGSDASFPGLDNIGVSVSGTDILFKVTGAASNTINWVLTLEWTETII